MKKLLYFLISLSFYVSYSQEDVFGNSPVQGIISIKRTDIQEIKSNQNRTNTTTNDLTPSKPTGNSTEVGVTEGQLSVSLTGGATYNIPIAVPPGINGIVPQIALSYNSQGGNGLAGYGWNISGVSVITRIPSTKFHDNNIDAVDFNNLDRFAFDGQRLMVKNGTTGIYGANGTVYETEGFSNVQITSYGVHPSGANYGPAYFIVQYPDGSIAHYGNSTTSRSLTDWAITYWQNPQGVRISYNYFISNNNLSISTIRYGTRLTTAPINEISFFYKTRVRPEQSYIGGQSFLRSNILSDIKVKGNNVGFRNYVLTHESTSLGYERLKSITEKSGDNAKSFNPTVFNYETSSENLTYDPNGIDLNLNNLNVTNSSLINGDFDGDGKLDFIVYPITGTNAKKKYWLYNNIEGSSINIGSEHNIGSFQEIFPVSWLSWNNKLMPSQGWCAVQTDISTNITSFKTYSTGISSPIYFQYAKTFEFPKLTFGYWIEPCNVYQQANGNESIYKRPPPVDPSEPVYNEIIRDIPKEYVSGDFNGDGLTDVMIIERPISVSYYAGGCIAYNATYSNPGGKAYFLNMDRRITTNYVSIAGNLQVTNTSKFVTADFNGDGKSDIYVFDDNVCRVYYLNNSNNLVLIATLNSNNIKLNKPILMGDYNGDGKSDFITPRSVNSYDYSLFYSKGNSSGFESIDKTYEMYYMIGGTAIVTNYITHSSLLHYLSTDIDNDGKTDLVNINTYTNIKSGQNFNGGFLTFNYFKNMGGGNFTKISQYNVNSNYDLRITYPIPLFRESDKINVNITVGVLTNNKIHYFNSQKDSSKDFLLKEVVVGSGVKEVITYAPLNSSCDIPFNCGVAFEPSTYTETYPNFDIKQSNGFKIVSKIEQVSLLQKKQQLFKYYGAVSNVEGLGFLGFRGLARTNWHNDDNPIISSISKHDITKRGVSTETYSVLGDTYGNFTAYTPTNFINKTNMIYVDQLFPNKVYKINSSFTSSVNGLDNTSKEVATSYDTNNNPLTITSVSKNGATVEKTEVVTIDYFPNTSSPTYIVGRLSKKKSSVSHNGDTMTGEEIYTYNTNHLVSKIQKKGHLTNYLTEDNIYDIFGNITQKKITAVGLTPRITNFTYDSTGRFLLSNTDIEGLITNYTYNTSNGLLLTQTLPSNAGFLLRTTNLYDVWGKKTKETDYLGKSIVYNYSWLSAGDHGYFATSSVGDDNSASIAWHDDLGRKIADGYRTINDNSFSEPNFSWETFAYDIYDRAIKTYEPQLSIFPASNGLYTETTFDVYGRTIQVVEKTGKTSNITYNGLTTSASDGVSNTTVVKNSLGNIVSNTDNGGTINYQHYANGNLKQSDFGGVIVKVEQDGWGRKTKLIDPSAGTYEYKYNEFGEITKEITPKGVTNYTIDNFGKVIQKTIVGTGGDPTNTKTTYTYNPTTKLLSSTKYDDLTGGFNSLYSYGYDNYKRIILSTESTPTSIYTRETQFDAFGRALRERYKALNISSSKSSEKWVKNTYKNGHHWQILDDATSQVLWQTTKVNARGQLTIGNYGNGINVTNTYDQYGFPTQFKHDKTGTPIVNVMTLNTVFEPQRGNLTSRYNSLFNYQENFTYDNLDRLKTYPGKEGVINQQDYDSLGRIKSNEVGSFNYTNVDPVTAEPKHFQNSSIFTNPNYSAYYANRFGIFDNSMEDKQGWDINDPNVFKYDASQSKSGKSSLKIENTTSGEKITHSNTWIAIDNATPTQYTYSVWVKSDGSNPEAELVLFMKTATETGYFTLVDSKSITTSNNWVFIEKTFTVPASIKKLNIRLDNNAIGNLWFDDVKIRKTSNVDAGDRFLDITYNAFKSPIDIIEEGKDKISFIYNMNNSRSTMYYGSLETNKLSRRYRKHYSADGSMEVKQDMVNGTVEFITFIGGDAYSAPIILKSDGTTQNYLYLHRDYLGSIVAITNQAGAIVEKRMFDAWGNIAKVQDGAGNNLEKLTFFDRGYTGHEHLQGVNLIHMNGRLYDPQVHRFLQPDNFIQDPLNTQNYNRYAYCWNNPFRYSDPSGEWIWFVAAAVIGGVFNWAANGCQFNAAGLGYFGTGAASGFLTALTGNPYLGAAVMGVGNSVTTQLSTTGKVDWGQVFGDGIKSVVIAGFSAGVSNQIGPYIDKTVGSVVTNSILKETISQGVTGFIGGFVVGAGFSASTGSSFNDALGNGWSSAKMGFVMGSVSGYVKGYIDVKAKTVSNADNAVKPQAKPTTQENTTTQESTVAKYFPENDGAVNGTFESIYLYKGDTFDRFGTITIKSNYVSPVGTPKSLRFLPSNNDGKYNTFKVIKPFPVQSSQIAPFGGTQYQTPLPLHILIKKGIIINN